MVIVIDRVVAIRMWSLAQVWGAPRFDYSLKLVLERWYSFDVPSCNKPQCLPHSDFVLTCKWKKKTLAFLTIWRFYMKRHSWTFTFIQTVVKSKTCLLNLNPHITRKHCILKHINIQGAKELFYIYEQELRIKIVSIIIMKNRTLFDLTFTYDNLDEYFNQENSKI